MPVASNIILLLDLLDAGVRISSSLGEAFRKADAEGRNITQSELDTAAKKSDDAFSRARNALK